MKKEMKKGNGSVWKKVNSETEPDKGKSEKEKSEEDKSEKDKSEKRRF